MKKLLLSAAIAAIITFNLDAQELQKVKTTRNVYKTEQQAIGKGTKPTNWVTVDGIKREIYVGSKGGQYYIVKTDTSYVRKYGTFR